MHVVVFRRIAAAFKRHRASDRYVVGMPLQHSLQHTAGDDVDANSLSSQFELFAATTRVSCGHFHLFLRGTRTPSNTARTFHPKLVGDPVEKQLSVVNTSRWTIFDLPSVFARPQQARRYKSKLPQKVRNMMWMVEYSTNQCSIGYTPFALSSVCVAYHFPLLPFRSRRASRLPTLAHVESPWLRLVQGQKHDMYSVAVYQGFREHSLNEL